jgi:probable HAF family extracellular repeat protein
MISWASRWHPDETQKIVEIRREGLMINRFCVLFIFVILAVNTNTAMGNSYGYGINSSGQVVGWGFSSDSSHAILWDNGNSRNLCNENESAGFGINDSGFVVGKMVGSAGTGDTYVHATLWRNGDAIDLGTLGGTDSSANGINKNGQIVGFAWTSDNTAYRAALWENGLVRDLGSLGGSSSAAQGVNTAGQIVGYSLIPSDSTYHAALWTNGAIKDLGPLEATSSVALAINDSGKIIGYYTTPDRLVHAALWDNGSINGLGSLGGDSIAYSINNKNQIVGMSVDSKYRSCATLWSEGSILDLNYLVDGTEWSLVEATGINDQGQITGNAQNNLTNESYVFIINSNKIEFSSLSLPITPTHTLSVNVIGSGSGTVNSVTPGNDISCGKSNCVQDLMVNSMFPWQQRLLLMLSLPVGRECAPIVSATVFLNSVQILRYLPTSVTWLRSRHSN